jgi:hypothetical protein
MKIGNIMIKKVIKSISRMYYTVWTDCIVQIQTVPANKKSWKSKAMVIMTMPMGVSFTFVMAIIQSPSFGLPSFYDLDLDIFPSHNLNSAISGFILFYLPFVLLNYFLIFRKKKYEKIIKEYSFHHGKYFLIFLLTGMFVPIIILVVSFVVVHYFT